MVVLEVLLDERGVASTEELAISGWFLLFSKDLVLKKRKLVLEDKIATREIKIMNKTHVLLFIFTFYPLHPKIWTPFRTPDLTEFRVSKMYICPCVVASILFLYWATRYAKL